MNLSEILNKSLKEGWALPHFNIADLALLNGICEAAKELNSPLLIGTSEGERKFIGGRNAVALIENLRKYYGLTAFLNADHHKSVDAAKEAIDEGYDSIHIDLSKLSFEENLSGVREVVDYARNSGRDISIEGEVGYLVTDSSKVYKEAIEVPEESLTKVEEAIKFVGETGINRLAPAVGSIHGISANEPKLDIQRIDSLRKSLGEISMVLHGGSGVTENDLKSAISAGINNIHVSTELRVVYTDALKKFVNENQDESAPYKIFKPVVEAVKLKAISKIKLFGSENKA